jgi:hypothetical protein
MKLVPRTLAFGAVMLAALGVITGTALADTQCPLAAPGSALKHIVFLEFDNLHLERDVPNVPSDLEQMPHLFQFLTDHGLLSANDHTVQISHTANGFLTPQAGLYSDQLGSAVSNTFFRFMPDGSFRPSSLFVYWTARVAPGGVPVLIDAQGKNTPAPWPAFTKAGCDIGYAGIAGTVLESVPTDLENVFGKDSPEAQEGRSDKGRATADFVGLAIHCAQGSALCGGPEAVADPLPDQSGGYDGFKALFGSKYVAPRINSSPQLKDLDGNPIQDKDGNIGFPGFDSMLPRVSLAYAAQLLEAGVPIVNAYASDAHDNHAQPNSPAFGPGTKDDVSQLAAYDRAFANFFDRLKKDGIDETDTLFVFTTDESDHFVGSAPSPDNCDGVHVPCTYGSTGEITVDLRRIVADQRRNETPFVVHADSAPAFYVTGKPDQTDPAARSLERDFLSVTALNPLTGETGPLALAAVDQEGMRFLHMGSADKDRLPTFILYQDQDFYGMVPRVPNLVPCSTAPPCIIENDAYAYNHGDFQEDIRTTWLGMAGPGVKALGLTDTVWSDHVDVRPTILALAGITSDYVHDGRALIEFMRPERLLSAVAANADDLIRLGAVYKEITAPFHELGLGVLIVSTRALKGSDADYALIEERLKALTARRDELAARIRGVLDAAVFQNKADNIELRQLIAEGEQFLIEAKAQLR